MHEVTSRPSATSPAQPPFGSVAPDRPSWRSLLLEGLVVYLVLGLLTIPFLAAIRGALIERGVAAQDIQYEVFGPDLWQADTQ